MLATIESILDFFFFVPFFPNYKIRRRMDRFAPAHAHSRCVCHMRKK